MKDIAIARIEVEHINDCSSRRESAHSLSGWVQARAYREFERTHVRCYGDIQRDQRRQWRFETSATQFLVASRSSLLPLAISLVVWPSTSTTVAADVSRLTLSAVGFRRVGVSQSLSGLTSAATGQNGVLEIL